MFAGVLSRQHNAEPHDDVLATLAARGDCSAYTALIMRYRGTAVAYAFARLQSRDEAEDVAQDAFVKAYEARGQFRGSGRMGGLADADRAQRNDGRAA